MDCSLSAIPRKRAKTSNPVIEHNDGSVHRYEGTVSNLMAMESWRCSVAPLAHEIMQCAHAMPR